MLAGFLLTLTAPLDEPEQRRSACEWLPRSYWHCGDADSALMALPADSRSNGTSRLLEALLRLTHRATLRLFPSSFPDSVAHADAASAPQGSATSLTAISVVQLEIDRPMGRSLIC